MGLFYVDPTPGLPTQDLSRLTWDMDPAEAYTSAGFVSDPRWLESSRYLDWGAMEAIARNEAAALAADEYVRTTYGDAYGGVRPWPPLNMEDEGLSVLLYMERRLLYWRPISMPGYSPAQLKASLTDRNPYPSMYSALEEYVLLRALRQSQPVPSQSLSNEMRAYTEIVIFKGFGVGQKTASNKRFLLVGTYASDVFRDVRLVE